MPTTRASLIARIKDPRDTEAWARFYELYPPLIYRYARSRGLKRADADDVRSKCYQAIVEQIKTFNYDKAKGGFKAWLRTIVNRRVADLLRKRQPQQAKTTQMRRVSSDEPRPDEIWEEQWKLHHLRYCVEQVRKRTSARNFEIFSMAVLDGIAAREVCDALGVNPDQVYRAKARILRRVRQEMAKIGHEEVEE